MSKLKTMIRIRILQGQNNYEIAQAVGTPLLLVDRIRHEIDSEIEAEQDYLAGIQPAPFTDEEIRRGSACGEGCS